MKKLFDKVKLEAKFRKAGDGHKLTDDSGQSSSSHAAPPKVKETPVREQPLTAAHVNAAVAAMERHEKHVQQTTSKPKRYKPTTSTSNAKMSEENEVVKKVKDVDITEDTSHFSVEGVKFVSALTGDLFRKSELHDHYRETLLMKLGSDDAVTSSSQMIHTLNKDQQKVQAGINTLCKYIDNITEHLDEEKYRKIRKGNKAFSERVATLEGAEEFLTAVGFKLTSLETNGEEELYFVLAENADIEKLKESKNTLVTMKPLVSKLYRNARVYKPSNHALHFHLPDEFFNLSMEEVKREQKLRTENVETEKQLRTKAMREAVPRKTRKYNYSLIRVRFPDGFLLQGTFGVYEKLSDVRQFISENLNVEWAPYSLKTSTGQVIEREGETLQALSLVPSFVLNLSWMEDAKDQLSQQGIRLSLKNELLHKIETLT